MPEEASPRYDHPDPASIFLGHHDDLDLWYSDQGGVLPTVIARASSLPSDYTSGMVFAETFEPLGEAKRRAEARGLKT